MRPWAIEPGRNTAGAAADPRDVRDRGDAGGRLIRAELDAPRTASAFIAGIQGRVQVLRSTGSVEDLEAVVDTLIDYPRGPGSPGAAC
jgi:hypothetical protein